MITKLSAPIHQLKRRARLLSRELGTPLHESLDLVAQQEGFASWSLLASQKRPPFDARRLLSGLDNGSLSLLAARPGQGKTMMGLSLALEAISRQREAAFFTLEYTERETRDRAVRIVDVEIAGRLAVIASDDISSETIASHLQFAQPGTVAVIDYLQILDQKRTKPDLSVQIAELNRFAHETGVVIAFLSQIDRGYDPASKPLPDMHDIRLPNPVDLKVFSQMCFMHGGRTTIELRAG